MTASQLVGACRRAGYAVVYDRQAGPRLVRQRPGAVLPGHLLESLEARRAAVVEWLETGRDAGPEPEVCPLCRGLVFRPDLCGGVCDRVGARDNGNGTGRCPYKPGGQRGGTA